MSLTAASKSGPNGSEYKFVSRRDIITWVGQIMQRDTNGGEEGNV